MSDYWQGTGKILAIIGRAKHRLVLLMRLHKLDAPIIGVADNQAFDNWSADNWSADNLSRS